jgi:hypothetical protein
MDRNRDISCNDLNWMNVTEESVLCETSVSEVLNSRVLLHAFLFCGEKI